MLSPILSQHWNFYCKRRHVFAVFMAIFTGGALCVIKCVPIAGHKYRHECHCSFDSVGFLRLNFGLSSFWESQDPCKLLSSNTGWLYHFLLSCQRGEIISACFVPLNGLSHYPDIAVTTKTWSHWGCLSLLGILYHSAPDSNGSALFMLFFFLLRGFKSLFVCICVHTTHSTHTHFCLCVSLSCLPSGTKCAGLKAAA